MRNLSNVLRNRAIDQKKLQEYGFCELNYKYIYQKKIVSDQFEVIVQVENQKMTSKLIDLFGDEEYVLVDVEDAQGEFVGKVREEYEKILDDIIQKCTNPNIFKQNQTKEIIEYIREKYQDELEFLWKKFDNNAIWRNKENQKWYGILMTIKEDKLGGNTDKTIEVLDLRYQKEKIENVIDNKKIFPGYHMNKKSWITIKMNKSLATEEIKKLIDNSYQLSFGTKSGKHVDNLMNKHEKRARELKSQGNNCSTSLHSAFSEDTKLSKDFPAPRSIEGKCGALLTAEHILREKGYEDKIEEFEKEFTKRFGYVKCIELMTYERRCSDYVGESASIVDEILKSQAEKEILRKKYLQIRQNIQDKENKSKIIFRKIIEETEYQEARIIALYKSLKSEVDTTELIKYSINIGKIVVLPKVVDDELEFYRINSADDELKRSNFGVEEPIENNKNLIAKSEIDLVIVPGICFDGEKNRLGFGKGYYDRFLSNTNIKTIGICFQEQILKNKILPVTENDIKMEKVITDRKK